MTSLRPPDHPMSSFSGRLRGSRARDRPKAWRRTGVREPLGSRCCSSRFSCRCSRKNRNDRCPQSTPINSTKVRSSHRPPHTNESPKRDSMKRETRSNIPPKNNALYFLIICSPSRASHPQSRSTYLAIRGFSWVSEVVEMGGRERPVDGLVFASGSGGKPL